MDGDISRRQLGLAGEHRALSPEAVDAALVLSGLRPNASDWREFIIRTLKSAGVISFAAGLIFLIAFNWQGLGIFGRFGVIELPLLLALVFAWVRGVRDLSGKLALVLAVVLTGGLLALLGQTYQSGANLYELFFAWAGLTLPWAIACRYAPCWALWLLIANLAVSLYAGWTGNPGLVYLFLTDRFSFLPWLMPFLFNGVVFVIAETLSRKGVSGFRERWLPRAEMAIAMGFGTLLMIVRIFRSWQREDMAGGAAALETVLFIAAAAALGLYAYSRRDDLFAFAVLGLSAVVLTTMLVIRFMIEQRVPYGGLLVIAVYVILASSAVVMGIMSLSRRWKLKETSQ